MPSRILVEICDFRFWYQIIRELLSGAAVPKKKRKSSTQIGTPHSTFIGDIPETPGTSSIGNIPETPGTSSTGDIPETPGTSPTGGIPETPGTSSAVEILETPCTSDRVGNIFYAPLLGAMDSTPCSSGAVTKPSYHGHNIVEADPSPTTCTTCEYNKKKRKALLKKQNRLKKKYEALQQSYNKLQVSSSLSNCF